MLIWTGSKQTRNKELGAFFTRSLSLKEGWGGRNCQNLGIFSVRPLNSASNHHESEGVRVKAWDQLKKAFEDDESNYESNMITTFKTNE